ncbi:MAG: methyl-accepting chemotaxis protein [Proteobacteria bacterium]|nr:methyl-accepting chemotaxis protein [Pseudomonadota bacterium]
MDKYIDIIFLIVFFIVSAISATIFGFGSTTFISITIFVAITTVLFRIVFYYNTKIEKIRTQELVKIESSNLKVGQLSDNNPYKQIFQPLLDCFLKIQQIEKRLRETIASLFHNSNEIDEHTKNEYATILEISKNIEEIMITMRELTEKIETISINIDESSSATLELAASIEEVSEKIAKLFNFIDEVSSAIFQLIAISKELNINLDGLRRISEDTNSAMLEMEASIKEVEIKALESAKFTEEMEKDAQLGKEAIIATESSMTKIKESNDFSFNALTELSQDIKSIGKILQVIEDIAEETALLALNAAIIAAQSGDQGKSFSVVAEEIKELAERTGVSTKEIAIIIQNILAKGDKALNAITQSTKAIKEGVELTSQTGEIFKKILLSIEKADERVREIAKANIEQSKGITHIAKSTEQINQMVAEFTKAMNEQRKGAEQIIISTEKVKEIANFAKNSTAEQAKTSKQLGNLVVQINEMTKFFKNQVIKMRMDFETIAKSMLIIKPLNDSIISSNSKISSLLKNLEKELQEINTLRKNILNDKNNS